MKEILLHNKKKSYIETIVLIDKSICLSIFLYTYAVFRKAWVVKHRNM